MKESGDLKVDDRKFEVRCTAKPNGELHVKTQSLSVTISQLITRNGAEEMWDSILIICNQDDDGTIKSQIIVSHPDWDHNVQIAVIKSSDSVGDHTNPALVCELKPIPL
jgi:hypothetical protein